MASYQIGLKGEVPVEREEEKNNFRVQIMLIFLLTYEEARFQMRKF